MLFGIVNEPGDGMRFLGRKRALVNLGDVDRFQRWRRTRRMYV